MERRVQDKVGGEVGVRNGKDREGGARMTIAGGLRG